METCLIICRNLTALRTLMRLDIKRPMIIASDDLRVQESALKIIGVKEVAFIEKSESFWVVASDVKRIIGKIDEWLCSLYPVMEKEILSWGINVEGGFTGQRIQDALLLIRSYFFLFSSFNVAEVHTIKSPGSEWEDEILNACAKTKCLPFKRHALQPLACWRNTFEKALIPFAKGAYLILHEALTGRSMRANKSSPSTEMDGAIVFQLCGSQQKHVDNVKFIMKALSKRGLRAVCLCWSSNGQIKRSTGQKILAKNGIQTICMECFVSLWDFIDSMLQAGLVFIKGRKLLNRLSFLEYENVALAPILKSSIRYFFIAMLPQRIRYARALSACMLNAKPAAIKIWGGAEFFEGKLMLRLLSNDKPPIYIHYWLGVSLPEWPYNSLIYKPDLFLAKSQSEAELAIKEYGLTWSQVEVIGGARFDHLRSFSSENSVEKSRQELSIPPGLRLYIGVDPSGLLKGYNSYREQLELIRSLLNAAQASPNLVIAIKPHPNYRIDHLLPLIKSYNCMNVIVLDKNTPVNHFLNAIDILITKYSTLILEAALMRRCCIAAILDGEERFKVFGNMPVTIKSGKNLTRLIMQLESDEKVLRSWRTEQIYRQETLLPRYYYKCEDSASLAAERIIGYLNAYDETKESI